VRVPSYPTIPVSSNILVRLLSRNAKEAMRKANQTTACAAGWQPVGERDSAVSLNDVGVRGKDDESSAIGSQYSGRFAEERIEVFDVLHDLVRDHESEETRVEGKPFLRRSKADLPRRNESSGRTVGEPRLPLLFSARKIESVDLAGEEAI
jgi:hypothetical protein